MSFSEKTVTRLIPLLLIIGLAVAFGSSGGNATSCGGACFLPEDTVVAARH